MHGHDLQRSAHTYMQNREGGNVETTAIGVPGLKDTGGAENTRSGVCT